MTLLLSLHPSELDLLADWIERVVERDTDDSGLLKDEVPIVSGRITVASKELVGRLRQAAAFERKMSAL
jgi:hypothetical protein